MRVFSTFTGIGGFEVGIENAIASLARCKGHEEKTERSGLQTGNDKLHSGHSSNARFVGYSEIDRFAIPVYERHFKGVKNYGDITKINADELPDFDCLVGGFPCQAFSIAGHRRGFDDTRGTLFFDLARILRAKQPRLFVFENVKGLLSHDNGNTIRTIIATIDELGYDCQWQVVNSKNHGVPQNRERIVIVGHLRGTPRPEVFPLACSSSDGSEPNTEVRSIAQTVTATYYKGGKGSHIIAPTVAVREATKKGYAEATVGDSINLSQPTSKTRRGRVGKGIANTLTAQSMAQHTLTTEGMIRRLTPIECERLQGFPDNWTQYGLVGNRDISLKMPGEEATPGSMEYLQPMSDTQRYKMCGNAVTTNMIQAVFERILA